MGSKGENKFMPWPVVRLSLVFCLGLANMGNEGCEEEGTEDGRILRKRASVSKLTTPSQMQLPGGGEFDFEYVANSQIYDVLANNPYFTVSYQAQGIQSPFTEMSALSHDDFSAMMSWEREHGVSVLSMSNSTPNCIRYAPLLEIGGAIESFELVGGGGLTFGFGPNLPSSPVSVGASFMVESSQLSLNFQGRHPLNGMVMSTGRVPARQTKVEINLTIDFGLFRFGPSWFHSTPLSNVSYNAMTMSLEAMAKDYNQKALATGRPEWETKLRDDHDAFITIYGGSVDGLMVGDEIAIYNTVHLWRGDPCRSVYDGSLRENPSTPDGIFKIVDTLDFISRAEPLMRNSENPIRPGAQVVIHRYAGEFDQDENPMP